MALLSEVYGSDFNDRVKPDPEREMMRTQQPQPHLLQQQQAERQYPHQEAQYAQTLTKSDLDASVSYPLARMQHFIEQKMAESAAVSEDVSSLKSLRTMQWILLAACILLLILVGFLLFQNSVLAKQVKQLSDMFSYRAPPTNFY